MTFEIPLTKDYVATVDDEDADLVAFKWCALERRGNVYAMRRIYPFGAKGKSQTVYMHRVILERKLGYVPGRWELTDHVNGDGLLNTRENIRLANNVQNTRNNKGRRPAKDGLKGAYPAPHSANWVSRILIDGKMKFLGTFPTELEAHRAWCLTSIEHHKEFANFGTNSPFTPADFIEQPKAA